MDINDPLKKEDLLIEKERILKEHNSIILTNLRVIKIVNTFLSKRFQDIHYKFLNSIEYGQEINKKLFSFGLVLLLFSWFFQRLGSKISQIGIIALSQDIASTLNFIFWICLIGGTCIALYALIFQLKYTYFKSYNSIIKCHHNKKLVKEVRQFQKEYLES